MIETLGYYFGGLLALCVLLKLAGWFLFPEADPIDELADQTRREREARRDRG